MQRVAVLFLSGNAQDTLNWLIVAAPLPFISAVSLEEKARHASPWSEGTAGEYCLPSTSCYCLILLYIFLFIFQQKFKNTAKIKNYAAWSSLIVGFMNELI